MLKRELLGGFLVAGFLAADVPNAWWRAIFVTGHGPWTLLENVAVAPLLAVVSFVCSVGNIPLAAALWARGVAFGGVVAFIFADLVTLPVLFVYRKFYGTRTAVRMFVVFWVTMSTAGLVVDLLYRTVHALPQRRPTVVTTGHFDLGWTLVGNVAALVVVLVAAWFVRRQASDDATAIDPVCGMQVVRASAAATARYDHSMFYFCSPRCAERFNADPVKFVRVPVATSSPTGPSPKPGREPRE
jgi:YHS domain-containing protein